jgi:hypothetical protein
LKRKRCAPMSALTLYFHQREEFQLMGKTNELGPGEPQSREQATAAGRSAKLPLSRRLRCWWWGGAEGPNWEEPSWQITYHPPGPGAKAGPACGLLSRPVEGVPVRGGSDVGGSAGSCLGALRLIEVRGGRAFADGGLEYELCHNCDYGSETLSFPRLFDLSIIDAMDSRRSIVRRCFSALFDMASVG